MNNYINKLKEYLYDKDVSKEQIKEIVSDYEEFYEEYLNNGFTDEEIVIKLGSARDIYRNLRSTLKMSEDYEIKKIKNKQKSKIVSLTPFIATIIFILVGYFTGVWHPTWLIYLIVPLSSVLIYSKNILDALLNSSPFISTALFLVIGFYTGHWHPTWLVFLSIPLLGVIKSGNTWLKKSSNALIFIGVAISVLLPYFNLLPWKYAWLAMIIFIFPSLLSDIFTKANKLKPISMFISLLIAAISYTILVYLNTKVPVALLVFLIPFVVSIWADYIEINIVMLDSKAKQIIIISSFIIAFALFLTLGIAYNSFGYVWQLLLLPIMITTYIVPENKKHLITAITPFIAIIIFYSLGYFYGLWAVSWLAFLLIPIVSIIESNPVTKTKKPD